LNSSLASAVGELSLAELAVGERLRLFLQFLDFCAKCSFWAIVLVPHMLEGQSRAQRRGWSSTSHKNL